MTFSIKFYSRIYLCALLCDGFFTSSLYAQNIDRFAHFLHPTTQKAAIHMYETMSSYTRFTQPQRIVSLSPAATQMIITLGKQHDLVGVSHQCQIGNDSPPVLRVATWEQIQLEAIIALKPTFVITTPVAQWNDSIQKIVEQGIPVLEIYTDTLHETWDMMRAIGAQLNVDKDAAEHTHRFIDGYEQLKINSRKDSARPTKRMYFVGIHPFVAVGKHSLVGSWIQAIDPHAQLPDNVLWPSFNLEQLLSQSGMCYVVLAPANSFPELRIPSSSTTFVFTSSTLLMQPGITMLSESIHLQNWLRNHPLETCRL